MDLYHVDIRLPEGMKRFTGRAPLAWSRHADRARRDDRYGEIPKYRTITFDNLDVIEIGMEGDKLVKVLFRGHFSETLDLCIVVMPGLPWLVKTVWLNEKNDTHKTLDRSKYVC